MSEDITKVVDSIVEKVDATKTAAAETKEKVEAINKSVADLSEKQKLMDAQILELQQKGVKFDTETAADSVGDQFVKSESFKALASRQSRSAAVEIQKAEGDTPPKTQSADPIKVSGLLAPYRVAGIQSEPDQTLTIESLIPHLRTTNDSIQYLKEKAFTNGAGFIKEAELKPNSTVSFELKQAAIQTIAHWTKVTRQLIDDAPALAAFINARMVYGVNLVVDSQLIKGDGTGANLSGLLNTGNYTAQDFTLADLGGNPTLLDLLRLSIAKVNAANYHANAILLNPMDWAKLQGVKGTNAQYLYGVPSVSFDTMNAWGVRVITSASMPEGKYLAGDFTQAATIYDRMSTVIDIASQNEDDFVKNLYTIRAERRLTLVVEHPAALVGGNLAVPAAA